MGIGENIKHFRKMRGLKQSELGEMLNVSGNTVSSWEVDRTEPNIGMIEKMCDIFQCSKSELLEGYPTVLMSNNREVSHILEYAEKLSVLSPEARDRVFHYIDYEKTREENQ